MIAGLVERSGCGEGHRNGSWSARISVVLADLFGDEIGYTNRERLIVATISGRNLGIWAEIVPGLIGARGRGVHLHLDLLPGLVVVAMYLERPDGGSHGNGGWGGDGEIWVLDSELEREALRSVARHETRELEGQVSRVPNSIVQGAC